MTIKSKSKRRARARNEEIEAPAKIDDDHVRNRGFVVEIPEG